MNASFWQKCWQQNSLGFHQKEVHPFLSQYLAPLISEKDQHVFVPLCGKSLDIFWLAQQMKVSGSELSEIACRDFFTEAGLEFNIKPSKNNSNEAQFQQYSFDDITLWQGDYFKLSAQQLITANGPIDWIFDRAALIALPIEMQQAYIDHLVSFMAIDSRLFLISVEFPAEEMSGPPFPVTQQQLKHLFLSASNKCQVECIATRELVDKKFGQRNFAVSYLVERLYLITKS